MVRTLAEAEMEKCEFEKIRNQVEHVLLQLQVEYSTLHTCMFLCPYFATPRAKQYTRIYRAWKKVAIKPRYALFQAVSFQNLGMSAIPSLGVG